MDLDSLIEAGNAYRQNPLTDFKGEPVWIASIYREDYFQWIMKALTFLQNEYGDVSEVRTFENIIKEDKKEAHLSTLNSLLGILEGLKGIKPRHQNGENYDEILTTIFNHFHRFAFQLAKRHDNRKTIVVNDEYDVQDLLHAILRLHFDDVRPEEWVPSYAGGSKRMDFLLKEAKAAIEVKMTRDNLKDKQIGEQLIIDIANYKEHPDVDSLYCFVYDKDGLIMNPIGLEKDLEKSSDTNLQVKVFIRPQ